MFKQYIFIILFIIIIIITILIIIIIIILVKLLYIYCFQIVPNALTLYWLLGNEAVVVKCDPLSENPAKVFFCVICCFLQKIVRHMVNNIL